MSQLVKAPVLQTGFGRSVTCIGHFTRKHLRAMQEYRFSSAYEAIRSLGQPLLARRKSLVTVRETDGTEVFQRNTGNLLAVEGQDYVVTPCDGSAQYPCKIDIFHESWELIEGSKEYRRKNLCRVIPVPRDKTIILDTLEGEAIVKHPDFVALGIRGEVYCNSRDWVNSNLEFI
jgi:hypothetical protein